MSRRTWTAAVKLAVVVSVLAAVAAIVISSTSEVPQVAIVLPVIVVGFVSSWIQTGRVRRAQRGVLPVLQSSAHSSALFASSVR